MKCIYVHRMFIHIGIRKTRNTDDFLSSGTKLFIYLLEFKFFRHEERETQFLTMLTVRTLSALNSLTQPTRGHPVDPNWSRLGELRKSTHPSKSKTQLTAFFQIPKSSAHHLLAWRHSHPQSNFLSGVFIVTSVIVTSSPRAREHPHTMCAPN